jgi:hypothetical protein
MRRAFFCFAGLLVAGLLLLIVAFMWAFKLTVLALGVIVLACRLWDGVREWWAERQRKRQHERAVIDWWRTRGEQAYEDGGDVW